MNFELTSEQALLEQTIGRLVVSEYSFEHRLRQGAGTGSFWIHLAERGFLALPFDGRMGGMDGGPIETMIVMQALGRGLCIEPYLAGVVLVAALARALAAPAGLRASAAAVAEGRRLVVIADAELRSRHDLHRVETRAVPAGDGFVLEGLKLLVPHADYADELIVSARTSGPVDDPAGITLFRVAADLPGIQCRPCRLQDGRSAADIRLERLVVPVDAVVGNVGQGLALLEAVRDSGIAAVAAETLGILERSLELTLDHIRQRKQFGQSLGTFQALQHRVAEMLVELEQVRSMALLAALMLNEPDVAIRRQALSRVKAVVGQSGRIVTQAAVQLHGGLGVSDEHFVGHALKRVMAIEQSFGDRDHHLRLLAARARNDTTALR